MLELTVYGLGLVVTIVVGTAAGILALLSWRAVQKTPFEMIAVILALSLVGVIVYHVMVAVSGGSLVLETLRSVIHTALALFVWLAIVFHQQVQRDISEG